MRKLALFLLTLLSATLIAETTTINVANYQDTEFTCSGIQVSAARGNAQNDPAYNTNKKDLRIYAGGTLTVSAGSTAITAIEFVLSDQGKKQLSTITATSGKVTETTTPTFTWSGNSTTVTFTVGSTPDYGTATTGAGQLCFTQLIVTTSGTGTIDGGEEEFGLGKSYPIVGGRATYYGTQYSTNPNFVVDIYSDFTFDAKYNILSGDGIFARFDLYTSSSNSFVGTYTVKDADSYDVPKGMSKKYSFWSVHEDGAFLSSKIVSGTVSVVCTTSEQYNVTYNVTDEDGYLHQGTQFVHIPAFTSDGDTYNVTNKETALAAVTSSPIQVYATPGCICILNGTQGAEYSILNVLGQRVVASTLTSSAEEVRLPQGIYVVCIDGCASKLIVR